MPCRTMGCGWPWKQLLLLAAQRSIVATCLFGSVCVCLLLFCFHFAVCLFVDVATRVESAHSWHAANAAARGGVDFVMCARLSPWSDDLLWKFMLGGLQAIFAPKFVFAAGFLVLVSSMRLFAFAAAQCAIQLHVVWMSKVFAIRK